MVQRSPRWVAQNRLDVCSSLCSCSRSHLHSLGFSSPVWHCWVWLILCPMGIPQSLHPDWLFVRWSQELLPAHRALEFCFLAACLIKAVLQGINTRVWNSAGHGLDPAELCQSPLHFGMDLLIMNPYLQVFMQVSLFKEVLVLCVLFSFSWPSIPLLGVL